MWEGRLARAARLSGEWPQAAEILRFFRAVTSFQQDLYHRLESRDLSDLRGLDTAFLAGFFPSFLSMVEKAAPADIARLGQKFRDRSETEWEKMLRSTWNGPLRERPGLSMDFFPEALLHPQRVLLAERWRRDVGVFEPTDGVCPFCSRPPVAAASVGTAQVLVCSGCSTEWSHPKWRCPRCHETSRDRLRRFSLTGLDWIHLAACESCTYYLKVIDRVRQPDAVPVVDEAASIAFDRLARQKGFSKLCLNVVGV